MWIICIQKEFALAGWEYSEIPIQIGDLGIYNHQYIMRWHWKFKYAVDFNIPYYQDHNQPHNFALYQQTESYFSFPSKFFLGRTFLKIHHFLEIYSSFILFFVSLMQSQLYYYKGLNKLCKFIEIIQTSSLSFKNEFKKYFNNLKVLEKSLEHS